MTPGLPPIADPQLFGPQGAPEVPSHVAAAHEAAVQFEGLILSELLKTSFSGEGSPFGEGAGSQVYQGFLETYLAQHLADSGGLGLADQLAASLGGGTP